MGDVHYVVSGDIMVPAAETPFAKDEAFGFTKSNLREYVEEKTGGKIKARDVVSISIEDIRIGGPAAVREKLSVLTDMKACVVNAVTHRDVETFVLGLLESEKKDGKRFLMRSAASLVQARLGLPKRPILDASVINLDGCGADRGGLVVVGSYVSKTTQQLKRLLQPPENAEEEKMNLEDIKLEASGLVDPERQGEIIEDAIARADSAMRGGHTAVVYTSRDLLRGGSAEEGLSIGNDISEALVSVVSGLTVTPRFIIAKGGITSSDVATGALGIRRAIVLGQAAPGVPVWKIGDEGRFPGASYVVFPGNVGSEDDLARLVQRLSSA